MSPSEAETKWNENKAIFTANQEADKIFHPGKSVASGEKISGISDPDNLLGMENASSLSIDDPNRAGEHRIPDFLRKKK